MENKQPKVVIIVTTLNSQKFIEKCLQSIFNQVYPNKEVWVVDNGSNDKTVDIVSEYPVKLIKNQRNVGVCEARNQAIEKSDSEYILVMDSDVVLDKYFLTSLIQVAHTLPSKWGMFWGKVLSMRDENKIDTLGIYLSRFFRFYDWGQGKNETDPISIPENQLAPCACAALYRRELMEDIFRDYGYYFDPRFHYLVEDFDIAIRARKKGWKGKYVDRAIAYHFRHGSGFDPDYIRYLSFRNRYLLIKKHCKIKDAPFLMMSLLVYDLPRCVYMMMKDFRAFISAFRDIMLWR